LYQPVSVLISIPFDNGLLTILANILIVDFDDSRATKQNWDIDPALFRGTPPGEVGYFATDKLLATQQRDQEGEGYMLVFAHQWDWINPNPSPEPTGTTRIQLPLCASEQYTDATPGKGIQVQAWVDRFFSDADHEGSDLPLIGSLLQCSDLNLGPSALTGNEELKLRARGKDQFSAFGAWGTRPSPEMSTDRHGRISLLPQQVRRYSTELSKPKPA
jgi:hypothetical protein